MKYTHKQKIKEIESFKKKFNSISVVVPIVPDQQQCDEL
jgi:hypothetical protein